MSLDSEPLSSFSSDTRDWFFPSTSPSPYPSPSYIHSSSSPPKPLKYPRRFFTNSSRISQPYAHDSRPLRTPSVNSTPRSELKYAGIRRRAYSGVRSDRRLKPDEDKDVSDVVLGRKMEASSGKQSSHERGTTRYAGRFKVRWQMVFMALILLTVFSSLVHKIFNLQNQVSDFQGHCFLTRKLLSQVLRGSFSGNTWMGEMQQASDNTVIISEILDPRTKNLLAMSKISDCVLSDELVSMALAMVAEEGNEMHIREANLYLHDGEELGFYEILLRARQMREIVIGYRLVHAEKAVINPPTKNEKRKCSKKDVIAEKE